MRVTFTHDVEHALSTMVDLVNTDPATGGEELLPDVAALEVFVHQHAVSDIGELTQDDLVAVHATRPRLREIFLAESPRRAASLLNDLLSTHTVTPRLTDHDGYDWHIHYFAPGAALADHLAADCGMALAFFVVAGEQDRLRRCEAPDCRRAFVDLSRNRSRR